MSPMLSARKGIETMPSASVTPSARSSPALLAITRAPSSGEPRRLTCSSSVVLSSV